MLVETRTARSEGSWGFVHIVGNTLPFSALLFDDGTQKSPGLSK